MHYTVASGAFVFFVDARAPPPSPEWRVNADLEKRGQTGPPLPTPQKVRGGLKLRHIMAPNQHPFGVYHAKINQILAARNEPATDHDIRRTMSTIPFAGESDTASEYSTNSAPDRVEVEAFDANTTAESDFIAVDHQTVFMAATHRELFNQAQQQYGTDARVIVGNLPSRLSNEALRVLVEEVFGKYGWCLARVCRGRGVVGARRPYAIVQYSQHMDAAAAYYCGQEKKLGGRRARVEFSERATGVSR